LFAGSAAASPIRSPNRIVMADPYLGSSLLLQIPPLPSGGSSLSSYVLFAAVLLILLLLTALICGSEVAFFSLSAEERLHCRDSEDSHERRIAKLLDKPQLLLATLLIGLNLTNITFVTITAYLTKQALGEANAEALTGILIQTVGVTFILVFFGELIPKVWSNQNPLRFARLTAPMIEVATWLFKPISSMLLGISNIIEKRIQRKGYTITTDELNHALEITAGKETTAQEKDILRGIVNFGNVSARSIMRARRDVVAFELDWDFHELMDKINKSGYSRVPVFKESIDRIEGVLYIKDLLPHLDKDEHFQWQILIRNPFFIPENKKIDDLMYDFQEKRVHMAIVVNEYGETEGIVTMEDIIEEIVGDIRDEYDEDESDYLRLDENNFEFEGKTSLNDLCRVLKIDSTFLDEIKGESQSLAGLLIELFGRLPYAGEEGHFKQFTFKVLSVDTRRIRKIKVTVQQPN
jgi:putative hemolysin